ncbi:conserved hypothetical protein [Vibrio crassostreae]|nr:hypothetical protein EDB52_1203 [Vibrio crassostreae]TCT95087.1 hypothetical protein EDB47_1486 [Vibrio crassostreae]CAK1815139.1 conserved hypothetical protein [Vibrio crassostreae]CAK1946300.1 conserved hypothetical protein [Vibrio crassostreae]CAK1948122.1 conserved hypothetical protein [Vibrio crassostreae]
MGFWLFILVGIGLFIWNHVRITRITRNWESWPTVDAYIYDYNPTKGKGISCHKCGSHNIWETGFEKVDSNMRIHYCKQCKTNLYRTSR